MASNYWEIGKHVFIRGFFIDIDANLMSQKKGRALGTSLDTFFEAIKSKSFRFEYFECLPIVNREGKIE